MSSISTIRSVQFVRFLTVIVLLVGVGLLFFTRAYGDVLTNRSLTLSDSRVGQVATYQLSFTVPTAETLGSIELQLCSNGSLQDDPCVPPNGFDISAATLSSQSGETGFSILPAGTNANTIVLTRTPAVAVPGNVVSYTFDNVTNPADVGSFFGRIQTFASNDASGTSTDYGGLAMSTSRVIDITTVVPPYLLFCAGITITGFDCSTASGNYINFGNLSPVSTASANTELVTATNAQSGYVMQVYGTTMTSGNNIIPAIASADVSRPGTGQFGLNLVANTTPAMGADPQGSGISAPLPGYDQPNFFKFVSGDAIASATTSDDFRKLTASYIVNMPVGQPVGVYVATLTYVCLANF